MSRPPRVRGFHPNSLLWFVLALLAFLPGAEGVNGFPGGPDFERQRDIFPLPLPFLALDPTIRRRVSKSVRRRLHRRMLWQEWANSGVESMNSMAGRGDHVSAPANPTLAQRRCLDAISESYHLFCSDPSNNDDGSSVGALRALCGSSSAYAGDRDDVQPYVKDKVSWPGSDFPPVNLVSAVGPADSDRLRQWESHLLCSPADSERRLGQSAVKAPYSDPALMRRPAVYADFLHQLHVRGMVRWTIAYGQRGRLGVFFVKKKSGALRLIFDTRIVNLYFHDAPHTQLPFASSFSGLELEPGSTLYSGSVDIDNAFYRFRVPDGLADQFSLPTIPAGALGLASLDGVVLSANTQILPVVTVLPMGWAWSLHFCQSVMMRAISDCGFTPDRIIQDRSASPTIGPSTGCAAAGYVDNVLVVGTSPEDVNLRLGKVIKVLETQGLVVHEKEVASSKSEFVGLSIDGDRGIISIKTSRLFRLRDAIHELLRRNHSTGVLLEVLLGHITWALLLRRELMCVPDSCYAFIAKHGRDGTRSSERLWENVRRELHQVASLLPLCHARIRAPWHTSVTASDSSMEGAGVCTRDLPVSLVRRFCKTSERWRFGFEDAVRARAHAFGQSACSDVERELLSAGQAVSFSDLGFSIPDVNTPDDCTEVSAPPDIRSALYFEEIPHAVLEPDSWKVVVSFRWRETENILHTEGQALGTALRHQLRRSGAIGTRVLALVDNLPLALAATKGRAGSRHLRQPLREIASLCLASHCRLVVRWIPSEWNIADKPSHLIRVPGAVATEPCDGQAACPPPAASFSGRGAASCIREDPNAPVCEPSPVLSDDSGRAVVNSSDACRLSNAHVELHHLLPSQPAELGRCSESGRLRVRVLRPDVPERIRGGGGIEVPRSPRLLPSRCLEDGAFLASASYPGDSRLDQICSRTPASSPAPRASVRRHRSPTGCSKEHHGTCVVAKLPCLSATRRVQLPNPPAASGTRAICRETVPVLGPVAVSGRPQLPEPSRQDGTLGRGDIARPRPVAGPPAPNFSDHRRPIRTSVAVQRRGALRHLQTDHEVSRTGSSGPIALLPTSRRSFRGSFWTSSIGSSCETPRSLALGQLVETLWQGNPASKCAEQCTSEGPSVRPTHGLPDRELLSEARHSSHTAKSKRPRLHCSLSLRGSVP